MNCPQASYHLGMMLPFNTVGNLEDAYCLVVSTEKASFSLPPAVVSIATLLLIPEVTKHVVTLVFEFLWSGDGPR